MKFRLLLAIPAVALIAYWLALALVPVAEHASVYRVDVEIGKTLAFAGCLAAALRFGTSEYLGRAWLLNGFCYLLILVNDVFFRAGLGMFDGRAWAPWASGIDILVANVGQVAGTVMIARTWRVAGFELAGSPSVRRAVVGSAVTVAIAAAGWLVFSSARDLAHGGGVGAFVDLASSFADIIAFSLIAPFLLTAIALRGGSLAWTWTLFTASLFGWLAFDAVLSYGHLVWDADGAKRVGEAFRLLACTFGFAAGLAQRFAMSAPPAVERSAVAS